MKLSDSDQKRLLLALMRKGYWKVFSQRFEQRLWSDEVCYGLRRDLDKPVEPPTTPGIAFHIKPFEKHEIVKILELPATNGNIEAVNERLSRLLFLQAGITDCYGAMTEDGVPCYIQWLIAPSENGKMVDYHGSYFPSLAGNEVLLEGAFTPERFRGKGVMSSAMFWIAEKGRDLGARWAITYVSSNNTASLKGCFRSGFVPYLIRQSSWRLFRQKLTFVPINESDDVFTLYRNTLQNKAFL